MESKRPIDVYVVMPFSTTVPERTDKYWNEHYKKWIRRNIEEAVKNDPVLSAHEWTIERSSVDQGGPLNYEIVWRLFWADIVIADLTDLNANVLYELGIRHAFAGVREGGRTIMIQDERAFKLPFDFANYAVLKYSVDQEHTWSQGLAARLRHCVDEVAYRDNPASMAFAQRSWSLRESFQRSARPSGLEQMEHALKAIERLLAAGISPQFVERLLILGMSPEQRAALAAGTAGAGQKVDSIKIAPNEEGGE